MKQVQITKAGGPEVLKVISRESEPIREGFVRISTRFCGINFADVLARKGMYPDSPLLPCVVGYEASGIVSESRSQKFSEGDEVIVLTRFNGYSSELLVSEKQVFKKPAALSLEQAAAIPVNYITAWQLIVWMGALKAGETVLVHNAGGGVGLAALEIALHLGATVIGTASPGKHARLLEKGFHHTVDYRKDGWPAEVMKITGKKGVDLILDPVGGPFWKLNYGILRSGGRLGFFGVSYASTEKSKSFTGLIKLLPHFRFWNPAALMNANKAVFGVNLGHMWHEADRINKWAASLLEGAEGGWINPLVDATFPFSRAGEAHLRLEERSNFGKVLLYPD